MMENIQNHLICFLSELNQLDDLAQADDVLTSANEGISHGANHFVKTTGSSIELLDLKNYLQCYPLAMVMMAIIKHYELNKDTQVIQEAVDALLDLLAKKSDRPL